MVLSEARCIYCTAKPTQIEHMPPRAMFREKSRPNGMEFAACADCNNGSTGADAVASFFARVGMYDGLDSWATQENLQRRLSMEISAPGVLAELFDETKAQKTWLRSRGGVLQQKILARANGPLVHSYMTAFSAKLAMALYRHHIGNPIPMDGRLEVKWYFNAGLAETEAHALLSMLPIGATLSQGAWSVPDQFAYRYNTDKKEIVAALVGFHRNLHIFLIASSNPIYEDIEDTDSYVVRPGTLKSILPARQKLILP